MNKFQKKISIVVPVYNEEGSIKILVERLCNAFKKHKFKFEIIIVDDNSTDKTASIINLLLADYPVIYKRKEGKRGKAYSLIEGFSHSKFENIGFIDADLQYSPEDLPLMALKLKGSDVVVANRKKYKDSLVRKTLSRVFRIGFGKTLFKLDVDIQSGLKVFKKEVLNSICFAPRSPWTFDLEFLRNAREAGFVIASHDITFQKSKRCK